MRTYLLSIILLSPLMLLADVVDIDADQLNEMMEQDVVIIDVRTPGEWQHTGIVEGTAPGGSNSRFRNILRFGA